MAVDETYVLPSWEAVINLGGDPPQSLTLDVVEAQRVLEVKERELATEGKDHYAFLDFIIEWIAQKCGVVLRMGQADSLIEAVGDLYLKKKQKQFERIKAMRRSQSSTA